MTYIPFDSRYPIHKKPFGAVKQGTAVHFRVKLSRSLGCSSCKLFVVKDGDYCENRYEMYWCGLDENEQYEWWECDWTPTDSSLYWYRFDLVCSDGFGSIYKCGESVGAVGDRLDCWQLTVYDKDFSTPDWLKGGIMYQIFPDRFNFSGKDKKDIYSDRIMHKKWNERPSWRPDKDGEYRNNDYFGGDLAGITQKLDYIASLGVTCIYLNPIFEAHSNHRYNTADYSRIDPIMGNADDFRELCKKADKLGIKVILDGVFSHSGSDSIYFNREGRYGKSGAHNSMKSEYFDWYRFYEWPDKYECWWGFKTLPDIDENNKSYIKYITGDNGILQKWIGEGSSGWRLDVADELPNYFLEELRRAVKSKDKDALILGEVWEDASNKISYNSRRKFLLGKQLDTVMNYPFRRAIIEYIRDNKSRELVSTVMQLCENYPKPCLDLLMNCLSTHDTERIMTALSYGTSDGLDRERQNSIRLSNLEKEHAKRLFKLASVIQYTLPGVPSVYYGDEAGMSGCRDPFNRGTFPWEELKGVSPNSDHVTDKEVLEICNTDYEESDETRDTELTDWFCDLGRMRKSCPELADGEFIPLAADSGFLQYMRKKGDSAILVTVNKCFEPAKMQIPEGYEAESQLMGQEQYLPRKTEQKITAGSGVTALENLIKYDLDGRVSDNLHQSERWLQGMDFRVIRIVKQSQGLNNEQKPER